MPPAPGIDILFADPHKPLAPELAKLLAQCKEARIIVGFATKAGMRELLSPLTRDALREAIGEG